MHVSIYYKCTQTDINMTERMSNSRHGLAHAQQHMQGLLCDTEFNNSQLEILCCGIFVNNAK